MNGTSPRVLLARIGGAAAVLGGAFWVLKGVAIILTGHQPPVVYEAAVPLFAIALLGLRALLARRGGPLARVGAGLAVASLALMVVTAALLAWRALQVAEESFTAGNALVLATALAILSGLVVLGVATRRASALGPQWSSLPLAMGLALVPLMLTGGILSALDERLLEVPVVVFGLAWMALGVLIAAVPGAREDSGS